MQKQSGSQLAALLHLQSISASGANAAPPEELVQKWVHRWFVAALARLRIRPATMAMLLALYTGSYFTTAFATGAGWMEVATRHRIVRTLYWPINTCAVSEPLSGPRYINDANGWFFTIGWQWLHE